jgi:hypothetical protein
MLIALIALPALVSAQRQQRPGPGPMRRQMLEAQVFDRFMNRVSTDMRLDADARSRLERHVRESGEQRRRLAQQTVQLRRQILAAVGDSATSDAEIARLLEELEQLRARENQLWRSDQDALSRILNPRQRAIFMLQFLQFNDRIREVMQQRQQRVPR